MSKVNQAKLLRVLNTKWGNSKCPMCHNGSLNANDIVYELREFNNGNIVLSGEQKIWPVVPVTCNNCGYTLFVNAKIADVM